MRIGIVTQSASRLAYGIFPAVLGSSRVLKQLGQEPEILTGRDAYTETDRSEWASIPVEAFQLSPPRALFYAPAMRSWLDRHPRFDVISLHGVWMAMHATAFRHAKRLGAPVVMTPHGSLSEQALTQSTAKKRVARLLYTDAVLKGVNCLHALTDGEAEGIRRFGLKQPIAVIPNAFELPREGASRRNYDGPRKLLFLGRIHWLKGVRELTRAWSQLSSTLPEWELLIAGPDRLGLREQLERETRGARIRFLGEVRGGYKRELLQSSHAFILPSYTEGFPVAVLEAWSCGLPVIMTRESNVTEGFVAGAAVEVRPTVESITETLRGFLKRPAADFVQMGARGRLLVEQHYSPSVVGTRLVALYEWVLRGGVRPPFVHLD